MEKYLLIFLLVIPSILVSAQNQKKLVKHGISKKVEQVVDYGDGLKEKRVVEESFYDKEGQLIEFKDWTKDGKIKEWLKYTYTADGDIETETMLDAKGKTIERIEYAYENGLKMSKSYYDAKDRLVKVKHYEYSYF